MRKHEKTSLCQQKNAIHDVSFAMLEPEPTSKIED
jgi:hypothetical protein